MLLVGADARRLGALLSRYEEALADESEDLDGIEDDLLSMMEEKA